MKVVNNVADFVKKNDTDVTKIITKQWSNVLRYHDIEDLKNEIYEKLFKKEYIQGYRPFRFYVDEENGTWEVKRAAAKFSTYICTFIYNHISAYYGKPKPDNIHLSLEDYKDTGYNEDNTHKLKIKKEYNPINSADIKMEIDVILNRLKNKTKFKGTLVCDNDLDLSIAKFMDEFKDRGCKDNLLYASVFNYELSETDKTGLEKLLIERIDEIEEKGIIKSKLNEDGEKIYYLDDPERRSLYNLFRYYLRGYKDKEISEKFKMTVAGVGALKRSLRKEVKDMKNILKD